jgi:GntR family transcriptional regulator, transcriptional repressor for pyruvate dehydrogenase complex
MPRDSLADSLADQLLQGIIDGRYPTDDPLPPEADIAKEANVSRLTVREAVKTLRAKSIVRIDRGRGTYTNPPDRWTDLEALVRAVSAQAPDLAGVVPERLIEARRVIETGAAELAATRRTPNDLARFQVHLDEMVAAADNGDVDAFVTADLAFHQTVLDAADNAFIAALLEPLSRLLIPARRQTSEVGDIRRHAIEHHRAVLDAVRSGDPERARRAMHDHIDQTGRDLRTYVLKPGPKPTKAPSARVTTRRPRSLT